MSKPPDLDPNGPDLTLRQAAQALGCSTRTLRRYIEEGLITGLRRTKPRSGPWRFPQTSLIAYQNSTIQRGEQP